MAYSPTADMGLVQYPTPRALVTDLVATASGDASYVTGIARLLQDIRLWIATPQGGRFTDPSYGNPLWGLIGQVRTDLGAYGSMIDAAEQAFIAAQAVDVAAGTLSLDEQVTSIQTTAITAPTPQTIAVAFTVYSRAGTQTTSSVTIPVQ